MPRKRAMLDRIDMAMARLPLCRIVPLKTDREAFLLFTDSNVLDIKVGM